jgi:hypothetical protein
MSRSKHWPRRAALAALVPATLALAVLTGPLGIIANPNGWFWH